MRGGRKVVRAFGSADRSPSPTPRSPPPTLQRPRTRRPRRMRERERRVTPAGSPYSAAEYGVRPLGAVTGACRTVPPGRYPPAGRRAVTADIGAGTIRAGPRRNGHHAHVVVLRDYF